MRNGNSDQAVRCLARIAEFAGHVTTEEPQDLYGLESAEILSLYGGVLARAVGYVCNNAHALQEVHPSLRYFDMHKWMRSESVT